MIKRVAQGDIVRNVRTGELGEVKGWSDHEQLAQHGTILDVSVGKDRRVQGNGHAFELVVRAKPVWTPGRRVYWTAATLVVVAWGALLGSLAYFDGISVAVSVLVGYSAAYFAHQALRVTLGPRRTRIKLPARVQLAQGERGVGQPSVNQ